MSSQQKRDKAHASGGGKQGPDQAQPAQRKNSNGLASSSKPPSQTGAPAAPPKKRANSEIDDIFSTKKAKASVSEAPTTKPGGVSGQAGGGGGSGQTQPTAAAAHKPMKVTKVAGSKDDIFGEASQAGRKRTEEGFAIYSEAELGLSKHGGDTPDCPFDCDCCF